jgi:hypothetical protein
MASLTEVALGVAASLIAAEIVARAPDITRWLIGHAVRKLHPKDRERFSEEWLAHAEELLGSIGKIRHGLACYLRAASSIKRVRTSSVLSLRIAAAYVTGFYWMRFAPVYIPPLIKMYLTGKSNNARAWRLSHRIMLTTLVTELVYRKSTQAQTRAAIKARFEELKAILSPDVTDK